MSLLFVSEQETVAASVVCCCEALELQMTKSGQFTDDQKRGVLDALKAEERKLQERLDSSAGVSTRRQYFDIRGQGSIRTPGDTDYNDCAEILTVPQVRITFDTNWFEGNEAIVYDTSVFTIRHQLQAELVL